MKKMKLVVAIVLCTLLTACGGKKVNYSDFVTFTMSGINGHGKVDVTIDEENLVTSEVKEKIYQVCGESTSDKTTLLSLFNDEDYRIFTVTIINDNSGSLSNGDKVTAKLGVDDTLLILSGLSKEDFLKKIGIAPKKYEITYTVDGLNEGTTLDFQNVIEDNIIWEGAKNHVTWAFSDYEFELGGIQFDLESGGYIYGRKENQSIGVINVKTNYDMAGYTNDFNIGDQINFVLDLDDQFKTYIEENDIYIPEKMNIMISNKLKYAKSKDDLDEDAINSMVSSVLELSNFDKEMGSTKELKNVYFYTAKNVNQDYFRSYTHCGIAIVYIYTNGESGEKKGYVSSKTDIFINDRKLEHYESSYLSGSTEFTNLEDLDHLDTKLDNYNLEKIK